MSEVADNRTDLTYGPAAPEELPRLADVLSHGFGFPREGALPWFESAGHDNIRSIRQGGLTVGGLILVPMGHFFGGKSVPTLGVAGVGVSPEHRGARAGTTLMRSLLAEAHARRVALSSLYPATVTLYQRAGYERAGARFRIELDPRAMPAIHAPDALAVHEAPEVVPELRAVYTAYARRHDGFLDRGPYVWSRVTRPRDLVTKTFAVVGRDGPEGYVVLGHRFHPERDATHLTLTDAVATTGRAAARILALALEYRSICERVTWHGSPTSELVMLLPERHHTVSIPDYFMVRVTHPEAALSSRGYPARAAAKLVLELRDATLPAASGTYALACSGGAGVATRASGRPDVVLDERALASLYTGFATPWALRALGRLEASDAACEDLSALFGGPTPCIVDMF